MSRDIKVLAGIFTVSGVLHFVAPRPYEAIVPKPLPCKRELVQVSGAAEIACAGLLAAVFPANVQMTIDSACDPRKPWWFTLGTVLRLPLQLPMIRIALKAARG